MMLLGDEHVAARMCLMVKKLLKDAPSFLYVLFTHALFFSCIIVVIQELRSGLWRWRELVALVATVHLVGLGITVFYHRYFTHRAFVFTRLGRWTARPLLSMLAMASWLGPPKVWAAIHQRHHQHADHTEDPHGPIYSIVDFFYVGLILFTPRLFDDDTVETYKARRDSSADWYEKYVCGSAGYFLIGIALPVGLTYYWGVGAWYLAGVATAFYGTQVVNTVGHSSALIGSLPASVRNVASKIFCRPHKLDHCANTLNVRPWVAWVGGYCTAGELNHNNHHMYPNSAKVGHHWYDCDLGWWLIRAMELLRLVTRVQLPPSTMRPAPAADAAVRFDVFPTPPTATAAPRKRLFSNH